MTEFTQATAELIAAINGCESGEFIRDKAMAWMAIEGSPAALIDEYRNATRGAGYYEILNYTKDMLENAMA